MLYSHYSLCTAEKAAVHFFIDSAIYFFRPRINLYCNLIEGKAAMKRLLALLLIAAAIFFFAPLGGVGAPKTPKTHFFERLGAILNTQEGSYTASLDVKMPSALLGSGAATYLLGAKTNLELNLSGGFSGGANSLAASVASNPDSRLDSAAVLTDLVADGENIYLNLRSVFNYLTSVGGKKVNYGLFFPAEYITLSFDELCFVCPEASLLGFFKHATLKSAVPGSSLNNALLASLTENSFSESNGVYRLTLDNAGFLRLARAAIGDIAENSGEYANLPAAQMTGSSDSAAAAAQIKNAAEKLSSGLNRLTDVSLCAELSFIKAENAYKICVFCESEKEGLELSGVIKLVPGAAENASVPRKAMSLDGILNMLEGVGKIM